MVNKKGKTDKAIGKGKWIAEIGLCHYVKLPGFLILSSVAKSLQSLCKGLCEQNVMWILLLEGSLGVEKTGNKETFRKLLHVSCWETMWRGSWWQWSFSWHKIINHQS